MPLVARASNTVRNKNLLIVVMCLGFLVWFSYDGFVAYPRVNDRAVEKLRDMMRDNKLTARSDAQLDLWKSTLKDWHDWNSASSQQRDIMNDIATSGMSVAGGVESWKKPFDIVLQRYIVFGLGLAVLISVWWLVRCQQRRCLADDKTVSPSRGVVIPWEKITVVDNHRWKKSGIVEITYLDDAGDSRCARFDDYELDREPLLEILDLLAAKAEKAEFLPREEPPAPAEGSPT